ncbi:MAG: dihydropteroate synthase, partial [Acidobacteria bacterium]|nr:dihydropteroate synthase [Acidobacteriota bacterium]
EYGNTVAEVVAEIGETVQRARQAGIAAERILVDPGIGFGKRIEDNLALLAHLSRLGDLRRPIVVGTSRKSFIGRILERTVHDRLEGTLATEVVAVWNGAHILRTHDVAATVRAARITDAIRKAGERPENSVSRP